MILVINSCAICGMRAETSLGLATKSKAPIDSACRVTEAPSVLCELTTMTGIRCRRMISLSISKPPMPGISRSRVTTWGFRSSIFFSPKLPSMAVPTTWIELSVARICGISLRISAESSTTKTLTGGVMVVPPRRVGGFASGLHVRAGCRKLQHQFDRDESSHSARQWQEDSRSAPPGHRPKWMRH